MVLRKIFGPKMVEVTGDWRQLHSEELHDFLLFTKYYLGDHIKENGRDAACDV
jgi:hypothetical protein